MITLDVPKSFPNYDDELKQIGESIHSLRMEIALSESSAVRLDLLIVFEKTIALREKVLAGIEYRQGLVEGIETSLNMMVDSIHD